MGISIYAFLVKFMDKIVENDRNIVNCFLKRISKEVVFTEKKSAFKNKARIIVWSLQKVSIDLWAS